MEQKINHPKMERQEMRTETEARERTAAAMRTEAEAGGRY